MQIWLKPLPVLLISSLAAAGTTPNAGDTTQPVLGPTDQEPVAQEPVAKPPVAQEPATGSTDETIIKTYFKDGLRFETPDKSFTFKLGTRIAFDTYFFNGNNDFESSFGEEADGSKFRTLRVNAEGSLNKSIEYKWSYDFAGGVNNKLKDVYVSFKEAPGGNLRVGQFKEPMSLEQQTSSANITFMERSAADRLVPGRNIGIMLHDTCASEKVNWAAGIFRDDGSDTGQDSGAHGDYIFSARVSGAPLMTDATHLVHVGLSGRRQQFQGSNFDIFSNGETNGSTQALSRVNVAADNSDTYGLEAAWVNGPLSVQSELIKTEVNRDGASGLDFEGFYIFGSWFLTGESRPYKKATGSFGRVHVNNPYGKDGGNGAWEVAFRASQLDMNSELGITTSTAVPGGITNGGGVTNAYTLGLNWYLNDFTKVMINYVRSSPDDDTTGTPVIQVLQMRLQIDV